MSRHTPELTDAQWVPIAPLLPGLIEPTLAQVAVPHAGRGRPRKNPTRLIYDKAADSDPLRTRLAKRGIELICPHRKNRTKPPTQDGRPLAWLRRELSRTVGKLSTIGRAMGVSYLNVSSLGQCHLYDDHTQKVMKSLHLLWIKSSSGQSVILCRSYI